LVFDYRWNVVPVLSLLPERDFLSVFCIYTLL